MNDSAPIEKAHGSKACMYIFIIIHTPKEKAEPGVFVHLNCGYEMLAAPQVSLRKQPLDVQAKLHLYLLLRL